MKFLVLMFSSGLGCGLMPAIPGTWGTLAAAVVYWFFVPAGPLIVAVIAAVLCVVAVPISGAAERIYGVKDDGRIVIDEWAGYFVSVLFLPHTLRYGVAAFVLFRLFDVWKPLGIRALQKLPGGWGITIDDIAAGAVANLILQLFRFGAAR